MEYLKFIAIAAVVSLVITIVYDLFISKLFTKEITSSNFEKRTMES